ncbi:MAG TPA: DUF3140 domain-containing protein [Nocardioidaceae bacterium]|nr:DUF3140 domain-containing protein [Nocardioidaceae bacterium]
MMQIEDVWEEWKQTVNMTARELEHWLETDRSKVVGELRFGAESTGHEAARKIAKILRKRKDDLNDDDLDHIREVVAFVKAHLARRPRGDIRETRWRYVLMNWGHDPLKS